MTVSPATSAESSESTDSTDDGTFITSPAPCCVSPSLFIEEVGGAELRRRRKRQVASSLVLINAAAGLDGCDDQLLPASFRALEYDLGFYPAVLGKISLVQTMALAIACPVWGYLADVHSRRLIMGVGCLAWGMLTSLLAFVSEFWHVATLRALNGVFLGSIGPVSQSLLADNAVESRRGVAFGVVQLSGCLGRVLGGVVTTSLALVEIGGIYGWRWCCMIVGILSSLLGVFILVFMTDPPRPQEAMPFAAVEFLPTAGSGEMDGEHHEAPIAQTARTSGVRRWCLFWKVAIKGSFSRPTVIILLLEGMVGTIPWSAMAFMTLFFQYCGMTDFQAALVQAALLLGAMIAGPIAGYAGDAMFQMSHGHGRPVLAQVSMIFRIPLLCIALTTVPKKRESFYLFFVLSYFIGMTTISGVAVNRPILSEVVEPKFRASIFSLIVAIEGASAALLGAPVVGILSEKAFGYIRAEGDISLSEMEPWMKENNAEALSLALLLLTAIPWTLSFCFYSVLHFTYGKDRRRQRQEQP